MKMEELMIGDWVFLDKEFPDRVKAITNDYVILEANCDYEMLIGKDISPIPLTAEILEKNGWSIPFYEHFDVLSSQYQTPENDICVTLDNIHKELNIRLGDINYSMPKPNHVHELQRAMRCCGLWDLADKFVV